MEVKVYGDTEKKGSKIGLWNTEPRRIEPKPIEKTNKSRKEQEKSR